jgi:D-serine deaminase-like pyridoxal phosphate-dependent protein
MKGVRVTGLHVYDGHIRETDLDARERLANAALQPVYDLAAELESDGLGRPSFIVGGTPTFAVHAKYQDRICSPGTSVFWDEGYGRLFPELGFQPAAVLATRVISKLGPKSVCLDLGYKAIASESPPPRARFLNLGEVQEVAHSEEHLVLELAEDEGLQVGDLLYAVPKHICPTVALYKAANIVEHGTVTDTWPVDARDRMLTI